MAPPPQATSLQDPLGALSIQTTANFAGGVNLLTSPYFQSISAEWVIPNCQGTNKCCSWIGIDDDNQTSMAQAGWLVNDGRQYPFVQWAPPSTDNIHCSGKFCSPVQVTGFALQPGDLLALNLNYDTIPAVRATATFVNRTSGASTSVVLTNGNPTALSPTRALWLVECDVRGYAPFGATQFFGCQAIDTAGVAHQITYVMQAVLNGRTIGAVNAYANVATGVNGSVLVYQP